MMRKITVWVQSHDEEEEQYDDSSVQCVRPSQKAVQVGRRRAEDGGRIQEEEDRGQRATQKEEWRIKEAEEEKQMGNSRYEREFYW